MARTLTGCARCRSWLEGQPIDPLEARFLEEVVWTEEPAVRLAAARLLMAADFAAEPWVRDALDAVGFDPDSAELV